MADHIQHVVTKGTFSLDGGTWEVENNVWLIGDDKEVLIIDAAHDAAAIEAAANGRRVVGIICTHAHNDHINAAAELKQATGAPIKMHQADDKLWYMVYPDARPDFLLFGNDRLKVGDTTLHVLHTPGHAPGALCFYAPELGALFSGDTLFAGGPGATGWSFSDIGQIIDSIREKLLTLPPETVVYTGHGPTTTIGDEAGHLDEWIARGH